MALQFSTTLRNTWDDAITTAVGASGLLKIYSGTEPATVATALSGNTLLSTLTFNATFAPGSSGGVLTLNAITQDSSAAATGTASFFRATTSGGTVVFQGTVTATGGGGDLTLNTVSINSADVVTVTSWTITAPGA